MVYEPSKYSNSFVFQESCPLSLSLSHSLSRKENLEFWSSARFSLQESRILIFERLKCIFSIEHYWKMKFEFLCFYSSRIRKVEESPEWKTGTPWRSTLETQREFAEPIRLLLMRSGDLVLRRLSQTVWVITGDLQVMSEPRTPSLTGRRSGRFKRRLRQSSVSPILVVLALIRSSYQELSFRTFLPQE